MMSELQGGSTFAGAGSFSVDVTGAGNVNGNAEIDGSLSRGRENEDADMNTQNDAWNEEINYRNNGEGNAETSNFGEENLRNKDNNDVILGVQQYGNMNSQSSIQQNGIANSNTQGAVMQKTFRRHNIPTVHIPNQHLVCGYRYRIVYPSQRSQYSNLENEIDQPVLLNSNDQTSVEQFAERREFSGPFNHLL